MLSRYLLAALALLAAGEARADSTVAAMTAASALTGPELLYCVQGGADRKCTATQVQTFAVSGLGALATVTPGAGVTAALGLATNVSGGVLALTATVAGSLGYWNGSAWTTLAGNAAGTNCLQETAAGVPSWGACGGAAGLTVGTTTITGGTSGNFLYNNAGVLGERTPTQATAALNVFTTALQGLAPASGGGTTNFLRADGTWAAPGGGGLPLIGTGATITANAPLLQLSQTWNNAAVTFQGAVLNITSTASAVASRIMDFQSSGTSVFSMDTAGNSYFFGGTTLTNGGAVNPGTSITMPGTGFLAWSGNVALFTDGAGLLAQRNGTNAQTFRVYNIFNTTSDYERGVLDWTTTPGTLTIGTQNSGTGGQRPIQILASNGNIKFGNTSPVANGFFNNTNFYLNAATVFGWSQTGGADSGVVDIGFNRTSTKVIAINDGSGPNTNGWHNWAGEARATAVTNFNNTTTLGPVTGLTVNVLAGRTYGFQADLSFTDTPAQGIRAAIAGTATATNIVYDGWIVDSAANGIKGNAQATALAGVVANAATVGGAGHVTISGTITVNAAGTLLVQAAQSVAAANNTAVLQGSKFLVWDMP